MKQILQNLKTGEVKIADVPAPMVAPGHLLIKTRCSLISSGTERMLVSFAKSGLLGKARQQPEKVKQVIDKIKTDGLLPTINSVFARLDEPMPLGYCNCGEVIQVGPEVEGFEVGARVASNGPHAEIVSVPKNLCAKVPDGVTDEHAAFTVLASIGLQGIRLLNAKFGETVVVYGLGLIGLVCVQLLRASGCRVIGIDLDKGKLELAKKYGAEIIDVPAGADPVKSAMAFTGQKGVDGVLITASAHDDNIVHQSAQMSRKRGRIVLVGVVNLNLNRSDFYDKELSFQVSCSYGPGRYDDQYEKKGQDYPYGLVRWTEQRNFEAVLEALSTGALNVSDLISERVALSDANHAYERLTSDSSAMGLVLTYPHTETVPQRVMKATAVPKAPAVSNVVGGLIGAGMFAKLILLPALKPAGIRLKTVADINGVAAADAARKFGFEGTTNDYHVILEDPEVNTVFITTRHDLHANMVVEALEAGKNVHVEKPLCLNVEEIERIRLVHSKSSGRLHVGFNRRFSPHAEKIRSLVSARTAPICMNWMVNAGHIPASVWVQDRKVGGGRIVGEGCHWLDFMRCIVGAPIVSVGAMMMGDSNAIEVREDKMTISLTFADGSIGTLNYFANGHKSYPKETFELFSDGRVLRLDNFRKMRGYAWPGFKKMNLWNQDKGHARQLKQLVEGISEGKDSLIAFEEIENVMRATFAAVRSAEQGTVISLL